MIRIRILILLLFVSTMGHAQKLLSEGTIFYDIRVQAGSDSLDLANHFSDAVAIVYVKGSHSRSDLKTTLGSSVRFFDSRAGNGVVLREFGSQKILIRLNKQNWIENNKRYQGISFTRTPEKKQIAGYTCTKANALLKDGTSFTVYFTEEVMLENKDYDAQFKDLPGIPLEFESTVGKVKVTYTATKISFDPVPIQRFDIPKSGFREMTYAESIKAMNQ